MIGLDTNVLVRYLTQDEPKQAAAATRLFEHELSSENPGFVGLVALCELVRVLAECYAADEERLQTIIEGLLGSRQLVVEEADLVWRALRSWRRSSADFSDALMAEVFAAQGCRGAVTFDKAAAKLPGFSLLA